MSNCGADNGGSDLRCCSCGSRNSSNHRKKPNRNLFSEIWNSVKSWKTGGSSLYFSCIPLTTVRILTALLGTEHGSKYLLNWLVVPRNPLEPSSLPFYSFISRKDLQCAALFTCPPTSHPTRPLKSSPRKPFSQVSRMKRCSLPSLLQQGMGPFWGKLRMPTTEKMF